MRNDIASVLFLSDCAFPDFYEKVSEAPSEFARYEKEILVFLELRKAVILFLVFKTSLFDTDIEGSISH